MNFKYLPLLSVLFFTGCAYHGYTEYDIHGAPDRDLCQMARYSDRPAMVDLQISKRGLDCRTIALPGDDITKANVGSLSSVELCQAYEARPNKVVKAQVKKLEIDCKTTIDRWYQEQQLQLMQQQIQAVEEAKRQAAWDAFQNNLNQQQIIQQQHNIQYQNQMNAYRPITTNCSRFGYQTRCTSY